MSFSRAVVAIQRALQTGRTGTPVAARIFAHECGPDDRLDDELASIIDVTSEWMRAEPAQVAAQQDPSGRQLSAIVRFAGGQSLLASTGRSSSGGPPSALEITVFGTHGILSWEAASDQVAQQTHQREPSPRSRRLQDYLRQSLAAQGRVRSASGLADETPLLEDEQPRARRCPLEPAQTKLAPIRPPYGVLLVSGDATHQPFYAEALAADPRCRLIGVTDEADTPARRSELNQQYARRLGLAWLPDLQRALRRDDVHIVSICAEPYRRGRIIVAAAEAGKNLYLDKPLCGSLLHADRIVAAVRQSEVVGHMFSQVQWDTAQRARAIVDSGRLGKLAAVHCDMCFAKGHAGTADLARPRQETATPQRFELADSKRELTNVGVYGVVMLLWLARQAARRVVATTGNYFFAEHQANDMEDFGQVLLELDGGVVASVTSGRTGWKSHPSGGLDRIYLVGSEASAVVDSGRPRLESWDDGPAWTAPSRDPHDPMGMWAQPSGSPYRAEPKQSWFTPVVPSWTTDVDYFLDCLEKGRASDVSAELSAAATEVLLAAYQSAATGCSVRFPDSA
jgi:predicted dehydrogenase